MFSCARCNLGGAGIAENVPPEGGQDAIWRMFSPNAFKFPGNQEFVKCTQIVGFNTTLDNLWALEM